MAQNERDILDTLDALAEKFETFSDSVLAQLGGLQERLSNMESRLEEKIENGVLEASRTAPLEEDEELVEGIEKVSEKIDDLDARLEDIEHLLEEE